jgi:hypothetical protein
LSRIAWFALGGDSIPRSDAAIAALLVASVAVLGRGGGSWLIRQAHPAI